MKSNAVEAAEAEKKRLQEEIKTLKDQIALLKAKVEDEKNKQKPVVQPQPVV